MSLAHMRRMSCSIFPTACGCKPSGAIFCSPIAHSAKAVKKIVPNGGKIRMFSAGHNNDKTEHEEPIAFKEKVKLMWKKYGKLAIVTYASVYIGTLTSVFLALDFNVFNAASVGFDHAAAIAKVCDMYEGVTGNSSLPQYMKENPRVGTFAVAWVMTKFTEPLRLATTVAIVPSIGRYWAKITAAKEAENDNPK